MADNATWTSSSELIADDIDDATIVVDVDSGIYYQMTGLVAALWKHMREGESTLDELVQFAAASPLKAGRELRTQIQALLETFGRERLALCTATAMPAPDSKTAWEQQTAAFSILGRLERFSNLGGLTFAS